MRNKLANYAKKKLANYASLLSQVIQRKKHTFYVTSRRTSYYAKHREAITVPLQITKSTYRYKPRSHIKETTTYKYSKTSTVVPKQKQRRRDQASTRRQQQHQEFNVGGIKKNHRLHKNIIPRTSRKRRRDQNKQEATRTSATSHHQATRTKNAVQKHERDQDSQPSHRVCVCTVHATLLSGQQQVEWEQKESRSRPPKSATTTGIVKHNRHPSTRGAYKSRTSSQATSSSSPSHRVCVLHRP